MSNKYSLGGYRIALQAKSKKTLMVEGKDDKELFTRLNRKISPRNLFDIDSVDILNDELLSGLGAKTKIDYFLSTIPLGSAVSQKFRAFVDREWEDLIDLATGEPVPWRPPVTSDIRLTTNGHSIENYGFVVDFIISYAAHFGAGLLSDEIAADIRTAFPSLLSFAAAFSEVARRRSMISRCDDIVRLSCLDWDGSIFSLNQNFEQRLLVRAVADADTFNNDVMEAYTSKWSRPPFAAECHFHSHGHIGEMIIWVGIGKIAAGRGVSEARCEELAYGRHDERRRFWHTWLALIEPFNVSPIDRAFA